MEGVRVIAASEVTIEVKDASTGEVYRRTLPIDYYETSTILRLTGENVHGEPSELVFFSEHGTDRMKDMIGMGPDVSRCGGHH